MIEPLPHTISLALAALLEVAEPVVEAEEEQVIAPVVNVVEGQMDASMMDMEEDLAVLFDDDDFEDYASDGFGEEEAVDRVEQVGAQGLEAVVQIKNSETRRISIWLTTITSMSSRESTLMRCILGLEKQIAALERRPPGPQ
ncbi:hypothetical protein Tco_1312303 [Tanacetum coccineum]